jgi:hypothetical protein
MDIYINKSNNKKNIIIYYFLLYITWLSYLLPTNENVYTYIRKTILLKIDPDIKIEDIHVTNHGFIEFLKNQSYHTLDDIATGIFKGPSAYIIDQYYPTCDDYLPHPGYDLMYAYLKYNKSAKFVYGPQFGDVKLII